LDTYKKREIFLPKGKKLTTRADGPFEVLEQINDNAYKVDLPGEYGVSAMFNVANLSPYLKVPIKFKGKFFLIRGE